MSGYPQNIVPLDHVEPVPRRVRGMLGGEVVFDTTRALYIWELPYYPQFQIPIEDVLPGALIDEGRTHRLTRGTVARVGLRRGGVERLGAGRHYLESSITGLAGTIRFEWDALDEWYEEDEQIFVHPRNPYARVDAIRSTRRVRVELDGRVLGESAAPVMVFETGLPTRYYLDRTAIDFSYLRPSDTVTSCPYKGTTTGYWSMRSGDPRQADLAWSYDFPTRQLLPIAGLVAFYNEKVNIFIDGVSEPRPTTHFSD